MKKKNIFNSISTKLILIVTILILFTGAVVGGAGYFIARQQLLEAGKSDLKSIVDGSMAVLELLHNEVESGDLTLNEAQEQARYILNGPLGEDGTYQFLESQFSYKEEGYLLVFDQDYVLQLHPTRLGNAPDNDHTQTNREMMVEAAHADTLDDQYVLYSDRQTDGSFRDKVAYMQYFEPWDWAIGIAVFQDEFYEDLGILQTAIFTLTGVIVALSSVLFYILVKKRIALLKEVAQVATNIADGHISQTELSTPSDEIGQLADAFNRMSSQLHDMIVKIKASSQHLLQSATDLSAVSEESSASSQEVGHAINEIAAGTQAQATDLENINERVEQLTSAIAAMHRQSDKMEEITKSTASYSNEGSEIIERLQHSNAESLKASQKISQDIKALNNKVQEITAVMETIESIAEETNLLALNASIEAARAGEHGKGFSVVAEEIRKLAEQSKQATHQVQNVVSSIVNETASTVGAVEGTMKIAEELSSDVIRTQSKFGQLSLSIKESVSSLDEIKREVTEVTNHNQDISEAVESASSVSEQTAASVEEITASLDEQLRVMSEIANSAEALTRLNQELQEMVDSYTTE
ncbi:methyl-accepting chemotaxis protein [Amphibacillus sediminis]|uniref:methyl-accepting chemotaxis protein n=1 Tax=Amphibacillus sediminis TaxID=360185 RepID=UPI00082BCA00|nr:methyl-accepting chemotaxis protein [Amphibacillus sediminis]